MASNTLYPPVVNSVEPAFITHKAKIINGSPTWNQETGQPGELQVFFKFSALNSSLDKSNISVHATIHLKETGASIVSINDGNIMGNGTFPETFRLRSTEIILNLKPVPVPNTDYWYIILKNEDVNIATSADSDGSAYVGWRAGDIYKIQIRLSEICCKEIDEVLNQQVWLYNNADRFSEWSTVIYTKCISDMAITSYCAYQFNTSEEQSIVYPQEFQGQIAAIDSNSKEHYSSCSLKLYEVDGNQEKIRLIEEKTLYPNDISRDNFNYTIKYNFSINEHYLIEFSFITDNKYQSNSYNIYFVYAFDTVQICNYKLVTVDTTDHPLVKKIKDNKKYYASLGEEQDDAYVGLKIEYDPYDPSQFAWSSVNLRIVRASEETDFTVWEVIKYINLKFEDENSGQELIPQNEGELTTILEKMNMFCDFSIESNTFYLYGIQSYIAGEDHWTHIKKLQKDGNEWKIQRDFEYSYLLGKNQKQLKIKFNDNISNFMPQVYDSKLEPIGSKYPYFNRNAKTDYKIFPISGTISFEMDDNETFLPNGSLDIYNYTDVRTLHEKDWEYGKYNYGYERRFRQKVIDFLKDGDCKLFKSTTEGNIMVRLRDINCAPNQQLSRLIYNFSANADEIDDYNLDTLQKYGIVYPGTYVTDWNTAPAIPIPSDPAGNENFPHSHGSLTTVTTPYMRITV